VTGSWRVSLDKAGADDHHFATEAAALAWLRDHEASQTPAKRVRGVVWFAAEMDAMPTRESEDVA
jgi:hypothetical protein